MGVISTKVVASALALGVVAGGVVWQGEATVNYAKNTFADLQAKISKYEAAEGSLLEKIGFIKADATAKLTDANGKIVTAKEEINNLKANKDKLQTEIKGLNAEITGLKAELNTAKETITAKEAELAQKIAELSTITAQLSDLEEDYNQLVAEYNDLVRVSEANATEAQRANAQLQEANEDIAELRTAAEAAANATELSNPLTKEELDAIGTTNQPEVFSSELVVQNLGLTYIQDGNSEAFKSQHPDLNIQDGDRVWRVTNNNKFDVYVEYTKGSEKGSLVARPNQTFYLTETGGTMIIKWQDENGVWKQSVKAGA
ncbi:hypothetical protein [Fictibacillus sp. 26RED30]|jgi:uncharacterized protein YoxC|uniref:hypothetical protein n=1 Tax=Fictibacillus sp. 26RED30 TaxID=2745877 RepID=UPI0018CDD280|nr:hypothetical protein [Fictibacillus sp. 26RED30]MBH0161869.1 hypothetical protein [Fictibacillus sp. 26RED30]